MKYLPTLALFLLLGGLFLGVQSLLPANIEPNSQAGNTGEVVVAEEPLPETEEIALTEPLEEEISTSTATTTEETTAATSTAITTEPVATTTPELAEETSTTTIVAEPEPEIEVAVVPPPVPLPVQEVPPPDQLFFALETDWREACIRGAYVESGYSSTGECLNDRRPN